LLKDARVTSVLVGVSKEQQLLDNIASLSRIDFSTEELNLIDQIISELKN
jgi:L-glyceraldehyde 3-phosphate reductase